MNNLSCRMSLRIGVLFVGINPIDGTEQMAFLPKRPAAEMTGECRNHIFHYAENEGGADKQNHYWK